jgi:hypothetical protein
MKPIRKETQKREGDLIPFPRSIPDKERGWMLDRRQVTELMGRLSKIGLERITSLFPQDIVGRQMDNGYEAVWGAQKEGSAMDLAAQLAHRDGLPFQSLPSAGLIVYDTSQLTYAMYYDKEKKVVARAVVARLGGGKTSWEKLASCIEEAHAEARPKEGFIVNDLGSMSLYNDSGRRIESI